MAGHINRDVANVSMDMLLLSNKKVLYLKQEEKGLCKLEQYITQMLLYMYYNTNLALEIVLLARNVPCFFAIVCKVLPNLRPFGKLCVCMC